MTVTVEGFLLCDSAHDYGGRVSALGAFVSVIQARALPTFYQVGLVVRVAWPYDEFGDGHMLAVEFRYDADDELIARVEAGTAPHEPEARHPDLPIGVNLVAPIGLHLRRPGMYSVRLIIDGTEASDLRRPLKVVTELPVP
jgi:hypothetical protein